MDNPRETCELAMFYDCSKVIGPRPQGTWMGILTAAGSLARICGPVFVSEIYKEFGTYWTYGTTAGSFVLAAVVTLITYKRLIPIQKRIQMEKMSGENTVGKTMSTEL